MTDAASVGAAVEVLTNRGPSANLDVAEAHGDCANCRAHLQGSYCHRCGQKGHLHSKLHHLLHEFVEGIAHFDGRFWRTLPLLALRPGKLSRYWIEGKRARYVAPLHLFLFAVFLMFAVPSFTGRHLISLPNASERAELQTQVKVTAQQGDSPAERWARRTVVKVQKRLQNPDYYGYKIETLLYKLSFIVVPISMGILWLLMLFKRGYSLYDHGVVALYGTGFFALLLTAAAALSGPVAGVFTSAMILYVSGHAVWHLKEAYGLSWLGAVIRGLLLGLLSMIGFGFFVLGVFTLGLLG